MSHTKFLKKLLVNDFFKNLGRLMFDKSYTFFILKHYHKK